MYDDKTQCVQKRTPYQHDLQYVKKYLTFDLYNNSNNLTFRTTTCTLHWISI